MTLYGRLGLLAVGLAAVPRSLLAQPSDPSLLTLEEQAEYRDRLMPYLLLVSVVPRPDPLMDPSFLQRKHGMAVRVAGEGGVVVLTSAALVADAGDIEVSTAPEPDQVMKANPGPRPGGLAVIRCAPDPPSDGPRSPCDQGPAAATAIAGACDPEQVLHAAVPAGAGRFVLVSTVVAARGGVLPEDLALVQGRFPEGTPLFDAQGRVAAVVVRPAADSSARSLAAPLAPPGASSAASPGSPERLEDGQP